MMEFLTYKLKALLGVKSLFYLAFIAFLWYNHPAGEPVSTAEIISAAGLAGIVIGMRSFEKSTGSTKAQRDEEYEDEPTPPKT